MKKCPRCGSYIDQDAGACLNCGYIKQKKHNLCPECGDNLVRGVCYRCGYRKKRANNTCPYCRQKLIKGYCERCRYKKMDFKRILVAILIVSIVIYFFCR